MKAFEQTPAADLELDGFLEPFESAVLRGDNPDLSDYLPAENHSRYLPVLRELVRLDMEFGWERGDCPRLESYVRRFPALARDRSCLIDAAREEFRQREAAGEEPDPGEYARRFGITLFADNEQSVARVLGDMPAWTGHAMPKPGDMIPPGFIVRRELGRGAFGRVYLAEQADLASRLVAIKISTRLVREAQTLARLQHTNIMPIYSVHRVGDHQVLVMPFLGAATLADLLASIRQHGSLPTTVKDILTVIATKSSAAQIEIAVGGSSETEPATPTIELPPSVEPADTSYSRAILTIGVALADGLAHAHARGILHRDLKPANVLLTDDGRPMLLDFNLAADERGTVHSVGGTPRYMAPEHLASLHDHTNAIDGRADVYSLGLVLHELLTGRLPFPERSGPWHEVIESIRRDRLATPTIDVRSPAVAAVLSRCLAPLPDQRYQSADQLRDDLAHHLRDEPLRFTAEPVSRERFRKWARRHPRMSSGTTVATLAGILLFAIAWFGYATWQRAGSASAREARTAAIQARERAQPLIVDRHGPSAQLEEARQQIQQALEPYDQAGGDWLDRRVVRRLPPAEVDELRRVVAELLVYDAEATGRLAQRESDSVQRTQLLDEALTRNDRAAAAFPEPGPIRPIVAQRAWLLRLAGRDAEAATTARDIERATAPGGERILQALDELRARQYRAAATILQPLTQSGRGSFTAWMALGTARLRIGEFEPAADAFLAASALEPEKHWPKYYRGVALLSAGKLDAAGAEFARFIELQPDVPDARLNRAIVRFRLGDFNGVGNDLQEAERLHGSPTRILALRERLARASHKTEEADEIYARLLQSNASDVEGWTIRGESRLGHRPPDAVGALVDFDAALRIDPDHLPALKGKASCLAEHLNRPADALVVLARLLELTPESRDDRAGYAVLLARAGRGAEAQTHARKCVARESSSLVLYQAASALALTAKTPSEMAEVIELLRRVLRTDPSWANAMPSDPDLRIVNDNPAFRAIIAAARVLQVRPDKTK